MALGKARRRLNTMVSQILPHACRSSTSEGGVSQGPGQEVLQPNPDYEGPLHGLRVLDLSQMISGPMGTQLLADQGADVIKVETPGKGTSERGASRDKVVGPMFAVVNRNKRSVALDLKRPEGLAAFLKLVPSADILVQNFRPGVADRMGIGYEALKKINERLIYVSITGFGQDGPYSSKRVYDPIIQAVAGIASTQADANGRPRMLQLIVPDKVTAMTSAQVQCFLVKGAPRSVL
eukprot:TRINITY_DN29120_c0_g1_i5.p1 TRINITY_DN29120_c0_g1~~TRINITY_DN29120_c0_g1_i5.p1  ORF type:complete len:258 (+),score=34.03 TRINITY_DN29120_c0_g1_i5:68-775(+)